MTSAQFIHMAWTIAKVGYVGLLVLGIAGNCFVYSWEKPDWWLGIITLAARMTGIALGLHFVIRWLLPILERWTV